MFSVLYFSMPKLVSLTQLTFVIFRGNEILAMSSGKHPSIMLALVATMPQVVAAVLDRCIIKSDTKTDSEHYHVCTFYVFCDISERN